MSVWFGHPDNNSNLNQAIDNFQESFVQNLKSTKFQSEARKRFQTLAGITDVKPTGKHVERNQFGHVVSVKESAVNAFNTSNNDWGSVVHTSIPYDTGIFGDPGAPLSAPVFGDPENTFNGSISFKLVECGEPALQFDTVVGIAVPDIDDELPTERSDKNIKELVQEVMYDLERATDVKTRADLIMKCSRYIRLERMQDNCEE